MSSCKLSSLEENQLLLMNLFHFSLICLSTTSGFLSTMQIVLTKTPPQAIVQSNAGLTAPSHSAITKFDRKNQKSIDLLSDNFLCLLYYNQKV